MKEPPEDRIRVFYWTQILIIATDFRAQGGSGSERIKVELLVWKTAVYLKEDHCFGPSWKSISLRKICKKSVFRGNAAFPSPVDSSSSAVWRAADEERNKQGGKGNQTRKQKENQKRGVGSLLSTWLHQLHRWEICSVDGVAQHCQALWSARDSP